jgi:transcriptional regulator with XRE-family HTH domain
MTREKLLKSPAYWFEYEQNELFRQVTEYMDKEDINQTELAAKLNVSKGYVSQILNGNFNYTLKKLIEICLAINLVPRIKYTVVEDVIKEDVQLKLHYNNYSPEFDSNVVHFASYGNSLNTSNFSQSDAKEYSKSNENTGNYEIETTKYSQDKPMSSELPKTIKNNKIMDPLKIYA